MQNTTYYLFIHVPNVGRFEGMFTDGPDAKEKLQIVALDIILGKKPYFNLDGTFFSEETLKTAVVGIKEL